MNPLAATETAPPPVKPLPSPWYWLAEALVLGVFALGPGWFIWGLSTGKPVDLATGFFVMLGIHGIALWGMLRPGSRLVGDVQTRLATDAPEVWLTLDDGPSPETTPATLDLLRAAGARATFFVIGTKAEAHPDLIRRIIAEGHTLGNHTLTHPQYRFWAASPAQCEREVLLCNVALWRITRQTVHLFRPPAGLKGLFLHDVLWRHNLRLVNWSARGLDGVSTDEEAIYQRLLPDLKPGAIILLHEGRPTTLSLLPRVLEELKRRGLTCVIPKS